VDPATIAINGHVLAVTQRSDGDYGVLIGPGPRVYWFRTTDPPKLGTEVALSGRVASKEQITFGGIQGTIVIVDEAALQFHAPAYAHRVVAPEWTERVEKSMTRPLYRYQVEGAAWLASRVAAGKGAILADEPGLGKTTQTIAALAATRLYPSVLVCPTSIKLNWAREFQWAVRPPTITLIERRKGPIDIADVTIVNYELLLHREAQLGQILARSIVFDEAHLLKEALPPTLTHRASIGTRLANWFGRAILLTGTPISNRPRDLWRLLHMVDPEQWPKFADFELRYCRAPSEDEDLVGRQTRRIVTGSGRVERLDELHARIQPVLLRRLKSEVLSDLPAKSRRSLLISLDPVDMRAYQDAENDFLAWLRAQGSNDEARRAALAQSIVKLTALRRLAANAKMRTAVPDYLAQWFDRKAEPLVAFAYHADVLAALHHLCSRQLRLRVASIGSRDDVRKRQAAVDAFQDGQCDIFIAPITCAGVGINLHRAADAIFIERLWTPYQMTQAEDRVHRIGSTRPVTITYFDAAGTVDERLADVLSAKQQLIDHMLDEKNSVADATTTIISVLDRYRAA
jgi:SWI/SNF-related matrix-associated actin-dependent regulator of chromatin subfamily A-like protein 1